MCEYVHIKCTLYCIYIVIAAVVGGGVGGGGEEHPTSCSLQKVFPAQFHLAGIFRELASGWEICEELFGQNFIYYRSCLMF